MVQAVGCVKYTAKSLALYWDDEETAPRRIGIGVGCISKQVEPCGVAHLVAGLTYTLTNRNSTLTPILFDEMQGMTDAVLDAVRFEGSAEPSCRTDVAMLVESVCADMEDMGLDVTLETSTPMICICRTPEIKRALRNLIENAVRYGTRARVSIEQTGDSGQIHVDDDGAGIPEEQISRVFEPFVRLEESRNRDTGGYGLGLSIARMITRGHGGDVNLSNRKPHGLRATLSLPLA